MDDLDGKWVVPLLRLVGVLAWLLVLARLRSSSQDGRIGGTLLLVAILLFASSAFYLGAPMAWSGGVLNVASVLILAGGLWVLWRLPS